MNRLYVAMLLLLVAPVVARADGFSSRLAVGLLLADQADNLNGRGANTLPSLAGKPRSVTHLYPVPQFEVRYGWKENSIYVGTPPDEPFGTSLGYQRKLAQGAVSGAISSSLFGREWQNPYLVGTPRSATRVRSFGGRVALEEIGASPVTLAVKGTVKKVVHDELSGELRRDGGKLELELSWRQRLSDGWTLVPLAAYQRGEYQGAANSFHGGGLGLGVDWHRGDLRLAARLSGNLAVYDRPHPVFSVTRRDNSYRTGCTAILNSPFGWQNTYAMALLLHQWTDTNIDFFASTTTAGLVAIGYRF